MTGQENKLNLKSPINNSSQTIAFQFFEDFKVEELELESKYDSLKGDNQIHFSISYDEKEYKFELIPNQLISKNYKLTTGSKLGNSISKRAVPTTGFTSTGIEGSFALAPNFIYGTWKDEDGNSIYIEPYRFYDDNAKSSEFVLFYGKDIIDTVSGKCGVTHENHLKHKIKKWDEKSSSNSDCNIVELAIASDFLMFEKYGSVQDVENRNIGVINDVQNNYEGEFDFDLIFEIVEQYVVDCSGCDPWTSSTDALDLLSSFKDWGPSGFTNEHDIGELWTDRDLDGSTIGLAYLEVVCGSFRYHLCQDFSSNSEFIRVLTAHEMGHNFSLTHDDSGAPFIMAPAVNNTDDWSSQSVDQMNGYVPGLSCIDLFTAEIEDVQDEICPGDCDGEATATGGTSYEWSDGQTTATAVDLCPDTYEVTVSNASGCSSVLEVTIEQGIEVNASAVVDQNETCLGNCDGEATAGGGSNYEWSDGQTAATAIDLCPGTYEVTVSDDNGCSDVASVTIEAGDEVIASAIVDQDESCADDCDGQATASGGINYEWSDGQTTPSASNLCAGTYNVTVSSANGCSDVVSVAIEAGDEVTASAIVDQDESCAEACDGQATASGGTDYEWSNGQTTATVSSLCAGTYEVTVSDINGCSDVASVTIDGGAEVIANVIVDQDEICSGECNGEATASGGTNYEWSNGQTSATATSLCPGTYEVTVSDDNGCSDIVTVTIEAGGEVIANAIVAQDESCADECDGLATALGGTNYEWSDGQMSATAFDLCPGTYEVTVSDDNGCSDVASVTIEAGDEVIASAIVDQDESCAGDCDGQATASGGTEYQWSNGQTTATATGLCFGTHEVTVSDNNACSDVANVFILAGNEVIASAVVNEDESCAGECDGQATASGGTNYEWSNGQSTATVTGLCPGTYDVTVSDANGCSDVASVTIEAGGEVMQMQLSIRMNPAPERVTVRPQHQAALNYEWSNGQTGATPRRKRVVLVRAVDLCPGTYEV